MQAEFGMSGLDINWKADTLGQVTAALDEVMNIYQKEKTAQWNMFDKYVSCKDESGKKYHKDNIDCLKTSIKAISNANRRKNVLYFAHQGRESLGIEGIEWDRNPWILGCQNGVIDLKTGIIRDGKPEEYIKRVVKSEYKGLDVPAPPWNQFINEVFDDKIELMSYIQRLLGYSITGLTVEHILLIFCGVGRNGKGIMFETLHAVLGKVAGPIQSEMLLKGPQKSSGAPTSDIMSLQGKRTYMGKRNQ
jgi:putative DNA primase/helicase